MGAGDGLRLATVRGLTDGLRVGCWVSCEEGEIEDAVGAGDKLLEGFSVGLVVEANERATLGATVIGTVYGMLNGSHDSLDEGAVIGADPCENLQMVQWRACSRENMMGFVIATK